MHRSRKSAVAVVDMAAPRPDRSRMNAEEFAKVAARVTRVVRLDRSVERANTAGVMAVAAARAFNAQVEESRRLLVLAQGQLAVFGSVREAVSSELRRRARLRDEAYRQLVADHYPLIA